MEKITPEEWEEIKKRSESYQKKTADLKCGQCGGQLDGMKYCSACRWIHPLTEEVVHEECCANYGMQIPFYREKMIK